MKFRMIEYTEVPCWFELSWQEKPPALLLKIHSLLITAIVFHAQVIERYLKEHSFRSFTNIADGKTFGFNNAIRQRGQQNGFLVLEIPLPHVHMETEKECRRCEGSGEEKYYEERCWDCRGSGKEYVYLWAEAEAVSASLTVLLSQIHYPPHEIDTAAPFPQLLTVHTITQNGPSGSSLGGTYGRVLCDWLRTLNPKKELLDMVSAMEKAYAHMMAPHPFQDRSFRASLLNGQGWLNVSCPGDACGLHPSYSSDMINGKGYDFSCHNVDNPAQQLTLLAGLAALHDRARKEMRRTP